MEGVGDVRQDLDGSLWSNPGFDVAVDFQDFCYGKAVPGLEIDSASDLLDEIELDRIAAEILGHLRQFGDLVFIALVQGADDLGVESGFDQVPDGGHGAAEGAGDAAQFVVGLRFGTIDADRDEGVVFSLSEELGQVFVDQQPVGLDDDAQLVFPQQGDDVPEAGVQQRLAAGELHRLQAQRLGLFDGRFDVFVFKIFALVGVEQVLRRYPAVFAGQVAAAGQVEVEAGQRRDRGSGDCIFRRHCGIP